MDLDFGYALRIIPTLAGYIPITLFLAIVSMFFAVIVALILALIRVGRMPGLYQLAGLYISFFRGIPTLVQLFLIYYGLPQIIPSMSTLDALTAAIIGFSLKEASYLAEIFRAALVSVDPGQMEAGLAVGLNKFQIYRRIVLPQAAYNALPATGNIFVSLLKETSIAFTLGLTELFAEAKILASADFRYFETYLTVGLMYWALVIIYSRAQGMLETRLARSYAR